MYKKGIDKEACSRRREETTIRIRKNKRTEQLLKRRNIKHEQPVDTSAAAASAEASGLEATLHGLPALANAIKTGPPALQFQAVRMVRKLLSKEHDPPVQAVLDQGIIGVGPLLAIHFTTPLLFWCWLSCIDLVPTMSRVMM